MTLNRPALFNFSPTERREYEAATLRFTASAHIENYLDHAGLQAKDLAHRIRKSRSWVSKLLSGRQNATLDTLAEVAWALGARWKVDLVAADRSGTPAQNDPSPPAWTMAQPSIARILDVYWAQPVNSWTLLIPSATDALGVIAPEMGVVFPRNISAQVANTDSPYLEYSYDDFIELEFASEHESGSSLPVRSSIVVNLESTECAE